MDSDTETSPPTTTYDEAGRLHEIMDLVLMDIEQHRQAPFVNAIYELRQKLMSLSTFLRTSEEKFLYLDTNKRLKSE